jgi:hypothetical protein
MIDGDGRILFIAILIAFIVAVGIGIKYSFLTGAAVYFGTTALFGLLFFVKTWLQQKTEISDN